MQPVGKSPVNFDPNALAVQYYFGDLQYWKSMELQWRREVIENWLTKPSIPPDARTALREMLKDVNEEVRD